jgi:TolB protein
MNGLNNDGSPVLNSDLTYYQHPWMAAAKLPLTNSTGGTLDNLSNIILVESRSQEEDPHGPGGPPYGASDDVSDFSNRGGDLSAVGEEVHTMLDSGSIAGDLEGTSFAAPAVGGLAAYIQALDGDLSVAEVKAILLNTAIPLGTPPLGLDPYPPYIDAYAAILAVDRPWVNGVQFIEDVGGAEVRRAILDLDGLNGFDLTDVKQWAAVAEACGRVFDPDPDDFYPQHNYSRYDLNGDGLTFAAGMVTRFDLDLTDATDPQQTIEGEDRVFDEAAALDKDILCFYAYSELYDLSSDTEMDPDGNPGCGRREALDGICHYAGKCPETDSNELPAAPAEICPVGGQIAFHSTRDGNSEIYVMNDDGTNQRNLTFHDPAWLDSTPSWLPGLRRIGFSSDRDGDRDIWVMYADGSNPQNLTDTGVGNDETWPAWSLDGTQAAFTMERDIFTMNADGSNRNNLTNDPDLLDSFASWSADGKIAFASARDNDFEIYMMDANGDNQVNLTTNDALDTQPSWSPDGRRIAFMSDRDGNREIYVMTVAGRLVERVTNNDARDYSPTWSPDGTHIAFVSLRADGDGDSSNDGDSEIYTVEVTWPAPAGVLFVPLEPTQLTNNNATDNNPSWSP